MAQIDPALMEAAGFVGAQAGQAVGSAQAKAAINTNQLNLGGVQERRDISNTAEDRGMLRSSMTNTQMGEQTADQANRQQLIDLGLSDTVAGAQIDVMQELAQQQAQAESQASQRAMFDAEYALKVEQLKAEHPEANIDYEFLKSKTGGRVTGPTSANSSNWWSGN